MKLGTICVTMVMAVVGVAAFGNDPPVQNQKVPPAKISDVASAAVKAAYPNVTMGEAKLNVDRGVYVYYVSVTGDKSVSTVEVSGTGMVMQGALKLEQKDLPAEVAKAATAAAGDGATFFGAQKLDIRIEFSPKTYSSGPDVKMLALADGKNVTAYDVAFKNKDGVKGVVRVSADGKAEAMNWMKRASAVVPEGKVVVRINFGCNVDYTDESGVVWSADQMYKKDNKFGALDGRPHYRTNLIVLGTDAPFIYDSERDKEGAFRCDVPNGLYTVRIHMCETWEGAKKEGLREFGIKIQGTKVVDKMDIVKPAGGWMIPLVKEFKDIEVKDGKLVVEPFSNNNRDQHPSIEAYEVYQQ